MAADGGVWRGDEGLHPVRAEKFLHARFCSPLTSTLLSARLKRISGLQMENKVRDRLE